jgi:hypothetical protein
MSNLKFQTHRHNLHKKTDAALLIGAAPVSHFQDE